MLPKTTLEKLLRRYHCGVDINIKTKKEQTPLHIAANSLDGLHAAQVLLEHGAELEAMDSSGRTPLAEAVVCANLPMVQLLMKHGSSVHGKDNLGKTPLLLTVERLRSGDPLADKITLIKTLLDH